MGMGLSVCRSIIEAHDGRLWVTRNKPEGAVFSSYCPPTRESDNSGRLRPCMSRVGVRFLGPNEVRARMPGIPLSTREHAVALGKTHHPWANRFDDA
jgi:hypothetical protein